MKKSCIQKLIVMSVMTGAMCLGYGTTAQAMNPYMPLNEHIADAEPHVFTDPETGEERVYVYGSHDLNITDYCGNNYVVYSAPVDDLTNWTNHGVAFEIENTDELKATFIAPDVCQGPDGKFYLYTIGFIETGENLENMKMGGYVLVSDSPAGPFEILSDDSGLGFDPAVLVDGENVYVYSSGENGSCVYTMDKDMVTVLDKQDMVNSEDGGPVKNFYEGSSIRKVADDMYVFVYCSHRSNDPEYVAQTLHGQKNDYRGLLEYSYSDNPIGPWTYGGVIVDNGGEVLGGTGEDGYYEGAGDYYLGTRRSYYDGNVHGGIEKINDQWYVFYHRQTNNNEYTRQACAEPIDLKIEDGKLVIQQAEMTSQGVETDGLAAEKEYPAGIVCYLTNGAYITTAYEEDPDYNPIVNIRNSVVAGVKYMNFEKGNYKLTLDVMPKGQAGKIAVKLDDPASDPIAMFEVPGEAETEFTEITNEVGEITGKHAVFFVFYAEGEGEICEFNHFMFEQEK